MVQNNITVTEGDDAGPPPNIQIPLNIRQIINEENNKYNMHTLARSPFYRRHDGKKTRRYPVPGRDSTKHKYETQHGLCVMKSLSSNFKAAISPLPFIN